MGDLWAPILYGTAIAVCFPLGAFLVMRVQLSHATIAAFMSVGAGLLLAAASIDLTLTSLEELGLSGTVVTLTAAAGLFSSANWLLSRQGAKHRKRCGECLGEMSEDEATDGGGGGGAIALGTVLDAFPEALVLGVTLSGAGNAVALAVALALGNVAQSISSTSGLLHTGRSRRFVAALWIGLALIVIVTTTGSFVLLGQTGDDVRPWIEAFAAGILIAMTAEAMLPEAFHKSPSFAGFLAALGICGFLLVHEQF